MRDSLPELPDFKLNSFVTHLHGGTETRGSGRSGQIYWCWWNKKRRRLLSGAFNQSWCVSISG